MNQEAKTNKLIAALKNSNYKRLIKIRTSKLKTGGHSVYLDIWHNGNREYRFLKLYLTGDTIRDDEAVRLALSIRDKEEKQLYTDDSSYSLSSWKKRSDFIEYFRTVGKSRNSNWEKAANVFSEFAGKKIAFNQITHRMADEYKAWLLKKPEFAHNTGSLYFSILSAALNQAVKDGILASNPARFVSFQLQDTHREYLDYNELQTMIDTDCPSWDIKRAFLFSCFTGLRISDIRALRWQDISENHITIIQAKTKNKITFKLMQEAKDLLGERGQDHELVFVLPSATYIGTTLKKWLAAAGITKKITFHGARHTFAMLLLDDGNVDIYSLKGLLGHTNINTTQIYAKMIDKVKDAAIDKLSAAMAIKKLNTTKEKGQ